MPARPMLEDIELQQVQEIRAAEKQVLADHAVPGLEGGFLQRLGRRGTRILLRGILSGSEAREGLETLRGKFRDAVPVTFVADIATATEVQQVLIEEFIVRELAGKPERFEYSFTLCEYTPPPPPETEQPQPRPPVRRLDSGTLVVEVVKENDSSFDGSTATVTVEGETDEGVPLTRTLSNFSNGRWHEEDMPPGRYTVTASATSSPTATGSASAEIEAGQTKEVRITLRTGSVVARQFLISYRYDRSFVEPCMRGVLRRAAEYAQAHSEERLVIIGHTDRAGSDRYNQSLSERRARAVYAFLTYGRDETSRNAAIAEWNTLRAQRPGNELPSVRDNWGTREYQHILQDLRFYPGTVDGDHGPLTDDAVRAYRCQRGLPPGTTVDDAVWNALIRDYLGQDSFAVPADRFFPNCSDEADEVLKWLGCGEEDPVNRIGTAHRPSRRTEMLFVSADGLPCQIPEPDTFNLPGPGPVNPGGWCLGPGTGGAHCCLVSPVLQRNSSNPQPCPNDPEGPWCREPTHPGTLTVNGSIQREVRQADGTYALAPAASQAFVLITSRGEFKASEQPTGEPVPARTDSGGNFSFPDQRAGVYALEVRGHVLARLREQQDADVKGNAVCKFLESATDRLEVTLIDAPVLREIRLAVVAHLMTALHPTTREVRTCTGASGETAEQATAHTAADVRTFFDTVNGVWRQARIRFQLAEADIVSTAYSFRNECEVDGNEFAHILERCAYPNVVNVFFFGDLAGTTEAGMYVETTVTGPRGSVDGCAVTDRFAWAIFQPPVDVDLTTDQTVQTIAHELGHFLSLGIPDHVEDTPANRDRLMLPGTNLAGDNRTLVQSEVDQARGSRNAGLECVPLSLTVTGGGATRMGSPRGFRYLVMQNAPGPVRVEAVISPALVDPAVGTVSMEGGDPGAGPQERTVSTGSTGVTEITAIYTPVSSGSPTLSYAYIHVVTFALEVAGTDLRQTAPNTYVAARHATLRFTVSARIAPALFCVPTNLVTWSANLDVLRDPLARTFSRATIRRETVSATIGSTTRSATITIVEVALTNNTAPFETVVTQVQIEGILNGARSSFGTGSLFGTQSSSLFRARADLPGVSGSTIQATLTCNAPGGVQLERRTITLTRTAGDRFVSQPLLAIPSAIAREDITFQSPQSLEIIRAQAGGMMRLQVNAPYPLGGLERVEVPVRGRVIYIYARAFSDSGMNTATIRRHISHANGLWAQAGLEIKERSVQDGVTAPAGLSDLQTGTTTPAGGYTFSTEEERLTGSHVNCPTGCPTRSTTATDINIYYLRDIQGAPSGLAYENHATIALEGPSITDTAPSHEIGHMILVAWGNPDEHRDTGGTYWPSSNVMHRYDTTSGIDVHRTQVENILTSVSNGSNHYIIFEP